MEFVQERFDLSTDEAARCLFAGDSPAQEPTEPLLPAGIYRVIDGHLYRIVPGVSPSVDIWSRVADQRQGATSVQP